MKIVNPSVVKCAILISNPSVGNFGDMSRRDVRGWGSRRRKPKAESRSCTDEARSRKPEAERRKPKAASRRPKAESRKPEAEYRKPNTEAMCEVCTKAVILRSTLNTSYITGLDMCKVCTEAVHSIAL